MKHHQCTMFNEDCVRFSEDKAARVKLLHNEREMIDQPTGLLEPCYDADGRKHLST